MDWAIDYLVGPDYLKVMKTPLMRGRFFTPQDDEHAPPVVVIDDVLARTYFPDEDPIGKRVYLQAPKRTAEIVGVVAHVKQWGLDQDDMQPLRAQLYEPWMQMPDDFIAMAPSGAVMVVRYEGDTSTAFDAIRSTNRQMSSQQVMYGDQTMNDVISVSMATRRFAMILLGAFAALALLLACVGIYGVMAYLVSQRTQEIGIRMALGARRGDVLGLVLWRGARLTLIGAAIGLCSAMALTRLMRSLLFDVSPTDPIVLGSVSLLLIAVALAACLIPARRAASIDPMRALRTE
jgi:predicted permease